MDAEQEDVAVLIAQGGWLQGARWPLEKKVMVIGRGEDCDLVLADRQVSRHHAKITQTEGGYILEDLDSKNGTHHNGRRLTQPVVLQDGDRIQIALAFDLAYIGSEATLPLAASEAAQMGLGRLRIDGSARRVWVRDVELEPPLSPAQFALLAALYDRPGQIVSREEIIDAVWPESHGEGVSEQAIDALVRRLRDRLGEFDPTHVYLVTVRGHGFRLDNPV
ncbi:MAG: FHA domain-containing protein [Anaerolineales bacterium]|jgi:hypothetical protein